MPPKPKSKTPRTTPLNSVKVAFGKEFATFESKMPNWKSDLDNCSKDTLFRVLTSTKVGFDPTDVPGLANALLEYFAAVQSQTTPPRRAHRADVPDAHVSSRSHLNAPAAVPRGLEPTQYYDRQSSLDAAVDYIVAVVTGTGLDPSGKFKLFGSCGIKGIGKTEFLKQCATTVLQRVAVKVKNDQKKDIKLHPVYISFNGFGKNAADYRQFLLVNATIFAERELEAAAVGHLLLRQCGDKDSVVSFQEAVKQVRGVIGMGAVLVVLVDEVGELGDTASLTLIKAVMSEMDAAGGKLVFIFTHILEQQLWAAAELSGREVRALPLPALSIDAWKHMPNFDAAAKLHPSIMQLCLSCSGHPRAIFYGLCEAAKNNPTLLRDPDPIAIADARRDIAHACKFVASAPTRDRLKKHVPLWFKGRVVDDVDIDRTLLLQVGLLMQLPRTTRTSRPVEFLLPPGLLEWARELSASNVLAFHLKKAYHYDAIAGKDSDKFMEHVMEHFEAVLRVAVGEGTKFTLQQQNFKTCFISKALRLRSVSIKVPPGGERLVEQVDDFSDGSMAYVVSKLKEGYIVVSQAHSEVGVEYLAPFFDAHTGKLVVACVQCKFVLKHTCWKDIADKMKMATDNLEKVGVEYFPVVYTTADQKSIAEATFADGVYFTETELFEFTSPLGVLRLHKEKDSQDSQDSQD